MYEKLVLSNLDKEIMESSFLKTIDLVLSMIKNEKPNPYYKMNASMVTLQEELAYYSIYKEDIRDHMNIAMYNRSDLRFIYLPDKDFSFKHISFGVYSKISTSDQVFTTYFIGNKVKNDDNITEHFICYLIFEHIKSIVNDRYNIDIFNLIHSCKDNRKRMRTDFINAMVALINMYICYFKLIDCMLNLKYDDSDRIIGLVKLFDSSDLLVNIEELCYRYAITTDHSSEDYMNLCKECVSLYYNHKE